MTDLRKAAQDVLNSGIVGPFPAISTVLIWKPFESLREALQAEPEKPEPVAWLFKNDETGLTGCVDNQQVEWGYEKNNPRWRKISPLYTTPPNIQQLIDQAIEEHDEKMTVIRTVNMRTQAQPYLDALIAEIDGIHRNGDGLYIYADKIDAILDKYRGVK